MVNEEIKKCFDGEHRRRYEQPCERYLYLYVTTDCNLRCKHCYVGSDRLNAPKYFDVATVENVLEYFRVVAGHDKLCILGGEPTLHPDLSKIVDIAGDKKYSITINSNGCFSDDFFKSIPPQKIEFLNFSLEASCAEIHGKIRGNSSFEKVTDRIKRAVSLGYGVRVICTVSKANYEFALDMIPFVSNLGIDTLSFQNTGKVGNAGEFLTTLNPQEWMEFTKKIEAYPSPSNLTIYYPPIFVPIHEQIKWFNRGYPGCPARTLDRLHVYPDGTVYACPLLMDTDSYYAKFEKNKLVLNQKINNEMNAYLKADDICMGCEAAGVCGGGCPAYSTLEKYNNWYKCDKKITPLCSLWLTYAGEKVPPENVHEFR